ncbi:hypothetical protein F2Q69_00019874 [Brassica cretica]|uniref:Uncharacterized protein n=1 Tax=Brassica cretica TaxID=69181 RepID=A0A8S9PYF1_BRACR|nr:hypothetical protein F2Q69_00019874 [Brassica cretica]
MSDGGAPSRYVKLTKEQAPVDEVNPGELNQPIQVPQPKAQRDSPSQKKSSQSTKYSIARRSMDTCFDENQPSSFGASEADTTDHRRRRVNPRRNVQTAWPPLSSSR